MGDSPQVAGASEARLHKTAVGASNTVGDSELVQFGISSEVITILRGLSIFGQLESKMRRLPFFRPAPRQTDTGTGGGWNYEGGPAPVVSFAFDQVVLEPHHLTAIVAASDELFKPGDSVAEAVVRDVLLRALARLLDTQLLDPTIAAGTGVPGAITNGSGATAISPTGSSAAQIATDLAAMLAAIGTDAQNLVWILRPLTAARVSLALGAASDLPRTLLGIPAIVSANSPQQIALVDVDAIVYGDAGITLDRSQGAAIQMTTRRPTADRTSAHPRDRPGPVWCRCGKTIWPLCEWGRTCRGR